jgi:ADP-heptose:LPS heptosyltransferase
MWSSDRLEQVLNDFLERRPDAIALIVGLKHLGIDGGRSGNRIIECNGLPFEHSCALVAKSDLFLGVDSCMLHVADFCRVPSVGLFGPTQRAEFGFRLTRNITIQAEGAMDRIQTGDVLSALLALYDSLTGEPVAAGGRLNDLGVQVS